jgi:hypothetical protein
VLTALKARLLPRSSLEEPASPDPDQPDGVDASSQVEVEFAAYSEDSRVFGFWRHGYERMSDALNATDAYLLQDVLVASLDDGRTVDARELVVHRDEVLAVRAAGLRGNAARRTRVRPSPITLKVGPYIVHGYVHAPPGADPLRQIRRRKPMVPLTETWIEYSHAGQPHRARVGVIVVNVEWADWIRMSRDEEVRLPGLPAEAVFDPRAKDMTGYIHAPDELEPPAS